MYAFVRPLLFNFAPETAHDLALRAIRLGLRGPFKQAMQCKRVEAPCQVMGLRFPNRGVFVIARYPDASIVALLAARLDALSARLLDAEANYLQSVDVPGLEAALAARRAATPG